MITSDHSPDYNIHVANDLSWLKYCKDGNCIGQIYNPVQLMQCSCNYIEGGRSPKNGACQLHLLENVNIIEKEMNNNLQVHFNGQKTPISRNIDLSMFYTIRKLQKIEWPPNVCQRLWIVGQETGFIGVHLAQKNDTLINVTGIEPEFIDAKRCLSNFSPLSSRRDRSIGVICGYPDLILRESLRESDALLIILPSPKSIEDINTLTFDGIRLKCIIDLAKKLSIPVALQYSMLIHHQIEEQLKELNSMWINDHSFPLTNGHGFINELNKKSELIIRPNELFEYWHKIRLVVLNQKIPDVVELSGAPKFATNNHNIRDIFQTKIRDKNIDEYEDFSLDIAFEERENKSDDLNVKKYSNLSVPQLASQVEEKLLKKFHETSPFEKSVFISRWMGKILGSNEPNSIATQILDTITNELLKEGFVGRHAEDQEHMYIDNAWQNALIYMKGCKYGIAIIERIPRENGQPDIANLNVHMEIGAMLVDGLKTLLIYDEATIHAPRNLDFYVAGGNQIASIIFGFPIYPFNSQEANLETLRKLIRDWIKEIKQ